MKHFPDLREMIFRIQKKTGMTNRAIASRIDVLPSTLSNWKNGGKVDPLFSHGVALMDFYVKHVDDDIPRL